MVPMSALRTESVACGDAGSMDMHIWTPDGASEGDGTAAVLLIQEIFGVGAYIRSVAARLADAGYVVGAPDVFWRIQPNFEAPATEEGMGQSFGMVQQLDFPQAIQDCAKALGHLGSVEGVERAPAVLGFCMGGTIAWGVAAVGEPSACVSYYGSGVPDMLGMIDQIHCPTLLHFGNDDPYIAGDKIEAVNDAIAGHQGFALNVEIAGHAFDNHESEIFHDEAAASAAWAKTMAFLGLYLPTAG
ncbi:MAG: Carboxymethylenebutenolidase [Ilumatobacteraceae bacterium]|nr:Carboxymethylenebutenolidase [Ilumatobacteraceae bacterium]